MCARCLGPYIHRLVSAPNHPEADAAVTCSRVAVMCGKRLDPRKHMLHCGQWATGTQGCAACPRALGHSGDRVSKEHDPAVTVHVAEPPPPPRNQHLLSSPSSGNLNASKKGYKSRRIQGKAIKMMFKNKVYF